MGSIFAFALLLAPPTTFANPALATSNGDSKNGLIAFQRVFFGTFGPESNTIAIFTVKPNGTRARQITDPPLGVETGRMRWSPDGRSLVYMRAVFANWRPHIFVIRANGTHSNDLTRGHCRPSSCTGEEDPVWSPNGDRLAFIRLVGDMHSLFVMRSDGRQRRQVMTPPPGRYTDGAPAWSPDGTRLVFRRLDEARKVAALFTVRLDGANLRRITPWTLDGLNRPDWSPNGRWILFQKPNRNGRTQLCLTHPEGTGLRQITHSHEWLWASFSPDGTTITAIRSPGEASQDDVYVMNVDGSGIRPVTGSLSPEPAEGLPDWGPR